MWTFELAVIALMIVFNGVCAAYEIALASVSSGRLHHLVKRGRRGAAAASRMKEKMEGSLAVVQLGITLAGAIAAATGGAGAEEALAPALQQAGLSAAWSRLAALALVVAPLTVVTIVVGELVPKVFALRNKEFVCLALSPAMEWFAFALRPAVWALERSASWIVRWSERRQPHGEGDSADDVAIQEIHGAAAMARMALLIGPRQEGMIVSAARLAEIPLKQIMLPAEYIGMLTTDQSLAEALVTAHQDMHTRFPVTEVAGDPQRIIGYVNFKDIVATLRISPQEPSLRKLVRTIRRFPAEASAADCLERLMRERNHIALVQQRDGQVIGLITLEDIVEEVVGEIHDEFDRLPSHLTPLGDGWIAGGFVSLLQLRETTGIDLQPLGDKPILTLNDWILEHLGRPPRGGDEVEADGCRVIVRKLKQVLVQEAYIVRTASAAAMDASAQTRDDD